MKKTRSSHSNDRSNDEQPRELIQLEKLLLSKIREKHSVVTNGKIEELELQEILLQKYMQTALSGSPHALNQMTRFIRETEDKQAEKLKHGNEVYLRLKEMAKIRVVTAIEDGEDPKYVIYHPDDIVTHEVEGWNIRGVWNEETLRTVQEIERFCNVLLEQHFLEERLDWPIAVPCQVFPNGTPFKGSAFLFIQMIHKGLPKRFHITEKQYMAGERKSRAISKRDLLKHVYALWQQIGYIVPRGSKTPSFKDAYLQLESVASYLNCKKKN